MGFLRWLRRRREAQSSREALEPLEERVRMLELANAERQLAVLNTVEKVMNQLRARTKKREADKPPLEDAPETTNGEGEASQPAGDRHPTTAHLAARFRRY